MRETISIKLLKSLKKGKKQLSREALGRVAGFVLSQRAGNGMFVDKSGRPDVYYTLFGQMLSLVLGLPSTGRKPPVCPENPDAASLDLVHYAAYVRCRMLGRRFPLWRRVDLPDVLDFSDVPHNDRQSPYTRFILLSLFEDTGNRIRDKKELLRSLEHYHADSGGYKNTTDGLSATTNATVAALAVKGQLAGYREDANLLYLRELQGASGGFGAAAGAPMPDLLSTATALFVLDAYGIEAKYPARDFIEAHWLDSGGFSATLAEEKSDAEYTFYGLLALGATKK